MTTAEEQIDKDLEKDEGERLGNGANGDTAAARQAKANSDIHPSKRQQRPEEEESESEGEEDDGDDDESRSSSSESSADMDDVVKLQARAKQRIARAKSERTLLSSGPEPSSPIRRNKSTDSPASSGLLSRLSLSFNTSNNSQTSDDGDNILLIGLTKKVQRLEKEKQELLDANAENEAAHLAKVQALESGTDLQLAKSQLEDANERIKTLETQQTAWNQQVADLEKKLKDKQATIDQFRIEHPAPGVEPNVYRDLREEVAAAHSLIQSQNEHIEQLSKYASFQNENESKDLHTRVSELEMQLAKSELSWKSKLSQNSEDFRKRIDYWKVQANNWKIRFDQVWSDHQEERQHAKTGHGDRNSDASAVPMAETTTPKPTTAPGPIGSSPPSAEDQAKLLEAAMGQSNGQKKGWGWG